MRDDDALTRDYDVRPESGPIPSESLERDHEQRDLGTGTLFLSLVALALLVVVAAFGMRLFQQIAEGRARARDPLPSPMVESEVVPPEPRLERASGEVLRDLRAIEDVRLQGYSWVDREAGIAHLPVERAMEIVAELDGRIPVIEAPAGDAQDGGREQ